MEQRRTLRPPPPHGNRMIRSCHSGVVIEIQPALPQNSPAPWDRQPPARRCPSRQATRGYPITVQETVTGGRTFFFRFGLCRPRFPYFHHAPTPEKQLLGGTTNRPDGNKTKKQWTFSRKLIGKRLKGKHTGQTG